MQYIKRFLTFVDANILFWLIAGFLIIVPLYPKFPFYKIHDTYISIRLEDFYVAFMVFVFFIQVIRRKVVINKTFALLFAAFWGAVFASFAFNAYISKAIEFPHLGLLHSARRVEYMIPFFVAYAAVTTKARFKQLLIIVCIVMTIVSVYGFLQKNAEPFEPLRAQMLVYAENPVLRPFATFGFYFFQFPAVQTMNSEYAKGHLLNITADARMSSTFAGHYDLAAYYVFLMPILIGLFLWTKSKKYILLLLTGIFGIVMTASRSSFIAYAVSSISMLVWLRKWKVLILLILLTALTMGLSRGLGERLFKTVQIQRVFVNDRTGEVVVAQKITTKNLPVGTSIMRLEDPSAFTTADQARLNQKLMDDLIEEASKSGKQLDASAAASLIASQSAKLKPVDAVATDISFSTRLQVEWPRAFWAFVSNPVLGTGPASLTESTDSDYFRWIGETGALGTALFLGIIGYIVYLTYLKTKAPADDKRMKYLYWGYIFAVGGLVINASYIDVFEASKVAYTFWTIAGMFMAALVLPDLGKKAEAKPTNESAAKILNQSSQTRQDNTIKTEKKTKSTKKTSSPQSKSETTS